jgi:uroporphyrinogen-III decarboxylase
MGKTPEESYKERERRITDAIQLKLPDRVPIWFQDLSYFAAKYTGITFEEALYNPDKWFVAEKKTITYFEPDMYSDPNTVAGVPGDALEELGPKQAKWPGHGVSPYHTHQFVEGEYMTADEYDALLDDPTDFTIRTYLPRVISALGPIKNTPPIKALLFGYFALPISAAFALPDVADAFESFYKAGKRVLEHKATLASFKEEMKALGFPLSCGSITSTPFDLISDTLRGMRGAMLDMYRQPDKILAAIDKLLPVMIGNAVPVAKASGNPRVFIPIHRGAHGFMSQKQFETFYWPGLEKLVLALIAEELTPCVFFEGDYTSRLEYLAELPKGKTVGQFDLTDPVKAKKVLGDNMCIAGMMPVSLLQIGSPEKIKKHTKKLIDVVGEGGGFIMGPGSAMDECDPERVKIWVDFTKEYGAYK